MNFFQFKPIYQERVWGGRSLETELNRTLPDDGVYGESWEIVDREEANSVISTGKDEGRTLREFREKNVEALMGPDWPASKPFPILVKWLDCEARLSLQVHPPASVANKLNGEPKTENWFVARAKPGSAVLAGLKEGVTKEQFEQALKDDSLEDLICRLETKAGDSLFVESGRIHAIDGGNLILEIQQNSDTTYRVYDWGRVGLDGNPRQLHIEESMKSIDFDDFNPSLKETFDTKTELANSKEFRLTHHRYQPGEVLCFNSGEEPRIISIIEGKLIEKDSDVEITRGANVLLPFAGESEWVVEEKAEILITDRFNRAD